MNYCQYVVFCSLCACVCDPEMDREDQVVTGPHDKWQSPLIEFFMILLEW